VKFAIPALLALGLFYRRRASPWVGSDAGALSWAKVACCARLLLDVDWVMRGNTW